METKMTSQRQDIAAVAMQGIVKSFGGVAVLKEIDFEVRRGEVHALLGENGAGKSTLMKILEGVYKPDSGSIFVDGELVSGESGYNPKAHGITMVFQEFSLIPTLTVGQNILLGREPRNKLGLIDERKTNEEAKKHLDRMRAPVDPKAEVGPLAASYWQITEIAKALSQEAKVLVLDEPTASLTKDETDALFKQIRTLRSSGMAIVYISHRMAEIYDIADRITVLRNGVRVRTEAANEYPVRRVIADMLGEQKTELAGAITGHEEADVHGKPRPLPIRGDKPLLSLRNFSSSNGIKDINLDVYPGEIVGLAGLMGSGRSELARAVFGIDKITGGSITVAGETVQIGRPRDAVRAGLALVPEDRRVEGLVLEHSVESNAELPMITRNGQSWISNKESRGLAKDVIERLDVRTSSTRKSIGLLSGGNQQKVVIGKWLLTDPRVFILDEPTAGIDIGAKREIMHLLQQFAASGKAVVFISSELAELLEVSDRIVVMKDGRINEEYQDQEYVSEENLHRAVQGV
jgi:ribose transport system ATP-binding protein